MKFKRSFRRNVTLFARTAIVSFQRAFGNTRPIRSLQPFRNDFRLRNYQEDCIQSVLKCLNNGQKRLGISLATGSGKTVIFTHLIDRVPARNDLANQTLILAHRRELVEQAARHCSITYPDKIVEIELGNSHASGIADITVASVQSITSRDRVMKFDPSRFKLVLVDEAHHIVAPKYLEILEHFRIRPPLDDSPALVGVSATFSRFDGIKLGAAIDRIVFHRDYVDMINEGWLSKVIFTTVRLQDTDLNKVTIGRNGDFLSSSLSRAVNTYLNNQAAVATWFERCANRQSTIVFCVDVNHIHDLAAAFRSRNVDARFVTGNTPNHIRANTIDAFKKGEFPVLLNCGVFTEGTDIPNIDCVLLARPTKSRNLLVQMIGRGMRLSPGKENCHVIDMVASLKTGITTTPTLYGLDPDELVQSAEVKDLQDLRELREQELAARERPAELNVNGDIQEMRSVNVTYTDYSSISDLIEDNLGERHIRQLSRYSWVQVNDDDFVLSSSGRGFLRIQKQGHYFHVQYTARLLGEASPYARPRKIIKNALTLEDAVHGADKFAEHALTPLVLIESHTAWRKASATDAQVRFLNKFRTVENKLRPDTITKGKAQDMITKLKFGARGRFERMTVAKKRADRELENERKMQKMKAREIVKVGPLESD